MDTKKCPDCGHNKLPSEFHRNSCRKDGRAVYCAKCENMRAADYRRRNREKINAHFRNRYKADPEYLQRQKTNANRNYHKDPKRRKARHKDWQKQNPHYQRNRYRTDSEYRAKNQAYCMKYKALRKGASTAELVDRQSIIERDNATCYICGEGPLDNSEIHLDHVTPLSKGGPHTPDNIKVSCVSCNCSKQDKILD